MNHRPTTWWLWGAILAGGTVSAMADEVRVVDQVIEQPQRVGAWLVAQPLTDQHYRPGLMWMADRARSAQFQQRQQLVQQLKARPDIPARLIRVLENLPVTGRVTVDASVLQGQARVPELDAVLQPGDRVQVSVAPGTVMVLGADGQWCPVEYAPQATVPAYIAACAKPLQWKLDRDPSWLVQPQGEVRMVGPSGRTSDEVEAVVQPGAWIWVPQKQVGFNDRLSSQVAHWLATQGASGLPPGVEVRKASTSFWSRPSSPATATARRGDDGGVRPTSSDWGVAGLMQTPSARMLPRDQLTVQVLRAQPYTTVQVVAQPLPGLEVAARSAQVKVEGVTTGSSTVRDRGLDFKLRLREEQGPWPALALGMMDVSGSAGLGSEYLVGSRRWGPFDVSLGWAWGALAGRDGMRNPLGVFGDSWLTRSTGRRRYFHGRSNVFGGVQVQVPDSAWTVKLEYDRGVNRHDALGQPLPSKTPWNIGAVYRWSPYLDLTAGWERGRQAMVGVSLHVPWELLTPSTWTSGPSNAE